jgi:hypothetical protein
MTQTSRSGMEEPSILIMSIEDGKIKVVETDDTATIIDVAGGRVVFVSDRSKTYWEGKPEDVKKFAEEMKNRMIEKALEQVPPEQREQMRKAMLQMMGEAEKKGDRPAPAVRVEKTGEVREVLGRKTERVKVIVDGEVVEDLWLCPELKLSAEIDVDKFFRMTQALSGDGGEGEYQNSPKYREIFRMGIPLKERERQGSGWVERETTRLEVKRIPASEFQPPRGYRKVSLKEWFSSMNPHAGEMGEGMMGEE